MAAEPKAGWLRRTWRRLTSPSARWSVLALVIIGVVIGFVATAGTQIMVAVTGTDTFCGTACHSMQWVAKEHTASVHGTNPHGFVAGCHDCHIPKHYPELLWVKAKAGLKDAIGEMRGVISTEEKFKKERARMAQVVWDDMKANDSRPCRDCHRFNAQVLEKQPEALRPMHQMAMQGQSTCVDCHKGVAHIAPE
jgi:nitrate/TMAO reductase-like tetraheme cytochrome c subunit